MTQLSLPHSAAPAPPRHDAPLRWRALPALHSRRPPLRGLDALAHHISGLIRRPLARPAPFLARASIVQRRAADFAALDAPRFAQQVATLRARFRLARDNPDDTLTACALVAEAARRALDQSPTREQIAGALAIASGCLAEMATGEGKTLAATMPAAIAGWRGRGCHVLTANDYLADRDARWMSPVYQLLHLTAAPITAQSDALHRRSAYAADITYLTSKEAAADFLRDRLELRSTPSLAAGLLARHRPVDRLVMRGLEAAIVDEADALLLDDAVTPLIISAPAPSAAPADHHTPYTQAAELARTLELYRDFTIDRQHNEITLTASGRRALRAAQLALGGLWTGPRRAEELLAQALLAREAFHNGRQYIIREGRVVIIDDATGRAAPDRSWRDGLHQAIEAKEHLALRPPLETLARISFQRFFRLYRSLGAMTGTARDDRAAFWFFYSLPVVRIPTHRPSRRTTLPARVHARAADALADVAAEARRAASAGRPVLIGVRTIAQSQALSRVLTASALPHSLLSALNHEEEAAVIARAGQAARITIATNMAGRGTDIALTPDAARAGGLHVIIAELNESTRLDRQLAGRAARQGDPGSAISILNLQDQLLADLAAPVARTLARSLPGPAFRLAALALIALARARAAARAAQRRRAVLRADEWLDQSLPFTSSRL
ncbi:MAG: hypothetical protein SFZ24_03600 [Planctomycetota bacterium]|nr:hypothetical protein [Planctomycetota bacterium]